ncbi:YjbF family lipoprotein [Thioclava pacifica]|uniref:Group 4 capsule polysaccharide lipoprotein gfcB, YjbF n=1 Tax=Thioclava pacifica DSM 10166 TaxID=1353537 RepID=A0A074J4S0_9RHOB|nr:YjbF family lipoprotein [Thioclava pacifica]KEO50930.1 hypothetical protein TP2_13660 [Thioclava pacifica DSM 10166]
MRWWLAASILALAGCGKIPMTLSGGSAAAPQGQGVQVVVAQGGETGTGLEVVIPSRNASAVLRPIGQNGTIGTWASDDNISVSVDRGVVVATRGLGDDLMGADAEPTLAALRGETAGPYRRTYRLLDPEDHARYVLMGCEMETEGAEVLAGRRLIRNEESCATAGLRAQNLYWTDGAGQIVAARQWTSPKVGAIATAMSTTGKN